MARFAASFACFREEHAAFQNGSAEKQSLRGVTAVTVCNFLRQVSGSVVTDLPAIPGTGRGKERIDHAMQNDEVINAKIVLDVVLPAVLTVSHLIPRYDWLLCAYPDGETSTTICTCRPNGSPAFRTGLLQCDLKGIALSPAAAGTLTYWARD